MNVVPWSSGARISRMTAVSPLLTKRGTSVWPRSPAPPVRRTFIALPPRARRSLRPAQTTGFLDLGGRDRPGKCDGQFLGRLQRELDRDPRGWPKLGVHEIDGDGLLQ